MEEEYKDPLVSWDVADKARDIGFDKYCTECYTKTEDGEYSSQWSGLIPDMWEFECYRPSLAQLRTWISQRYAIELSLLPYILCVGHIKKRVWWVALLTDEDLTETERLTEITSFDKALDDGLHMAIKWIIKNKKHV
jgi:hypothetical protein